MTRISPTLLAFILTTFAGTQAFFDNTWIFYPSFFVQLPEQVSGPVIAAATNNYSNSLIVDGEIIEMGELEQAGVIQYGSNGYALPMLGKICPPQVEGGCFEMKYDDEGYIKEFDIYGNDELVIQTLWHYDDLHRVSKITRSDAEGRGDTQTYTYNSKGQLVVYKLVESDFTEMSTYQVFHYDRLGRVIRISLIMTIEREGKTNTRFGHTRLIRYTSLSHNTLIALSQSWKDGKVGIQSETGYQFDEYGNWTAKWIVPYRYGGESKFEPSREDTQLQIREFYYAQ